MANESVDAKVAAGALPVERQQFQFPPDEFEWEDAQYKADLGRQYGGVLRPPSAPAGVTLGQMAPQPQLPNLDESYKQIALGNSLAAMKPAATLGNPNPQALGMDPFSAFQSSMAQQKVTRAGQDLGTQEKAAEDYNKYALLRADITKRYAEQLSNRHKQMTEDWRKMQDETRRRGQDKTLEGVKARARLQAMIFGQRADLTERNKLLDQIKGGQVLTHMDELERIADEAEAYIRSDLSPGRSALAEASPVIGAVIDKYAPGSAEWMLKVQRPFEQYTDQTLQAINNARITANQVVLTREKDFPRYGLGDRENLRRINAIKEKMAETRSFMEHLMTAATALGAKQAGAGLRDEQKDKSKDKSKNKKVDEFGDPL